jgi:DNA polymerase alpha-associated DNA helicase A
VSGKSINVVVGPPGVGKTFLISHLVKSILEKTPDARLLVSAQNHETLIQMEDELKKTLTAGTRIVVRVERTRSTDEVIPFPHQNDLTMYGKDVMDFTSSGLRLM